MTILAAGTDKGLFCFERADGSWWPSPPQFLGWRVTALGRAGDGTYLAGTASGWYGPAIQRSDDLRSWEQVAPGPGYDQDSGRKFEQVWHFHAAHGALWVGVAEAGLFRSTDHGRTWEPVNGLNDHPTRPHWGPGGGGLCAHGILCHPTDPDRLWCGISAVGVFASEDGGESWQARNRGVTVAVPGERDDIGSCVHALAQDPDDPDRLYRQDHKGVYRSLDAGRSWQRIEEGLPAGFGFPLVADASTRRLFVAPQLSDERRVPPDGRFRVYRSDDRGDIWQVAGHGWPEAPRWGGVLRGAMATDNRGAVAAGTTSGELWVSEDSGDNWQRVDVVLPRVLAVALY